MAEIEHFVHPNKKQHPKFASIADLKIQLYSREEQLNGNNPVRVSLGDAVKKVSVFFIFIFFLFFVFSFFFFIYGYILTILVFSYSVLAGYYC